MSDLMALLALFTATQVNDSANCCSDFKVVPLFELFKHDLEL